MTKDERATAIALLREVCEEIGCTGTDKTCKDTPDKCSIIRKIFKKEQKEGV
jgi:hypothetical protein